MVSPDGQMDSGKADFCLEVEFERDSENPSRVFRSIYELVETFQGIDHSLVRAIDTRIEPVLVLEDIESGSIKIWLSNRLRQVPDEAAYNLDWKPIVGQYLVRAKYLIINFLEGRTQITDIRQIGPLTRDINQLAEGTQIRWLNDYKGVEPRALLDGIQKISDNLSHLSPEDKASYIVGDDKVAFNLEFKMAPDSLQDLVEMEETVIEGEQILKIKKPDLLGESQWELRFGTRNFLATIHDRDWLADFQARRIEIRPGDAIRARVRETHHYDYNGEMTRTTYEVMTISEIIPGGQQLDMFDDPSQSA